MIEPLTAFDQQQRLGQREGEGEKAEPVAEALPRRAAQQQPHCRHKDEGPRQPQHAGLVERPPQHTVVVKRDGENQAYAGAFLGKQDVGLDKAKRYTGENAAPHDDLIFQIFGASAHKISNQQHEQRRGECKDQAGLEAGRHGQQHRVDRVGTQIQVIAHRRPDTVKGQHRQQCKGREHNIRCVVINRAADSALVPVAAAGHPDRRGKVDHQTDQQPRRARGIGQGSAQAAGEHGNGGQMERRQQHGNADAPGQCIRRADEQRHGGVDHAALREGQVHTKVGGIGVAATAGGAKLLVVQPDHGRSKCRQRRKADRPQQAAGFILCQGRHLLELIEYAGAA